MTPEQKSTYQERIEAFLDGPSGENLTDFVIGPALEAADYEPEQFEEVEQLVLLALVERLMPEGYKLVGPSQE